jgi:hypothetical protein
MHSIEHAARALAVTVSLSLGLGLVAGCSKRPAATAPPAQAEAPRPAHPNLSGVWLAYASSAPGTTAAAGPQYSPAGQAKVEEFYAQFTEVPDPGSYCVGTGMPGVMLSIAGYPIEIIQSAERITMLAELEMQLRRIYLDGRGHPNDFPTTGVGHSIGRWDGETLVIDTALLKEWQARPWPRTEHTRIEERLYLTKESAVNVTPSAFITEKPISDDVLVDELTVTDPALYGEPQRRTMYYRKVVDTATLEYDCPIDLWLQALEKNRVSP